jgi:uncharacterized membrane protein
MEEMTLSGPDRGIGRLEAFSDGVYAIAITLLILDIKVPRDTEDLIGALLAQWPSYFGYVVTFIIIAIWWANHHSLLETMERSDHALLLANSLHLMCIAFLPFSTALLSEYLRGHGNQLATATVVYVGTLLAIGVTFMVIWQAGVRAGLLRRGMTKEMVARNTRLFTISLLLYTVAFALSFVFPTAGLAICIGLALYYGLPIRAPHRHTTHRR